MHPGLAIPLWAVVGFVVFKVGSVLLEKHRSAARAEELGCLPTPALPDAGIFGVKHVRRMLKADKEQRFLHFMTQQQENLCQIHGRRVDTFTWNTMGQTQYVTSDPENIKAMLATQFADFDLGSTRRSIMIATLGDGIFVQDGKKWEHSRALLRPNFVRDQVSDLDLEERHVQHLLKVMPIDNDGWTAETNIQVLFFRLTIDSATEFLFGESVDSLLAEAHDSISGAVKKDERAFSPNFDNAQTHLSIRFRLGDMHWIHNPKEFRENNKAVKEFVRHYVDRALQRGTMEKTAEKQKYIFLDELAQQTRDPEELSAQITNILVAGRDTTSSLLSWLFHELLRNPDVFAKLRSTILDTFGTFDDPKDITFATLKNCQYLQYCLNESLRKWPVVPSNVRRTNKTTTLPRGGGPDGTAPVYLPAQTDVNYSVYAMMRRKDLWGPDADEFRPERFVGRKPGWEYLPFNGGPRICIGQQFALTEASYVVVRLLQKFDAIRARPEELQAFTRNKTSLTSCPGRPVTLWLHEAKE